MVLPLLSLRTSSPDLVLLLLSSNLLCWVLLGVLVRDASGQKLRYRCRLRIVSNFLLVDISWPEHLSGRQGGKVPGHLLGKAFLSKCSCKTGFPQRGWEPSKPFTGLKDDKESCRSPTCFLGFAPYPLD